MITLSPPEQDRELNWFGRWLAQKPSFVRKPLAFLYIVGLYLWALILSPKLWKGVGIQLYRMGVAYNRRASALAKTDLELEKRGLDKGDPKN